MSRLCPTTSDYLRATSGIPNLGTAGSVVLWVYPTTAYNDNTRHKYLKINIGGTNNSFDIFKHTTNNIYAGWYVGPSTEKRVIVSASFLVQNNWNMLAVTWNTSPSPGLTTLWHNGATSKGTAQCSVWDTSAADGLEVGGSDYLAAARVWGLQFYNKVLSSGELNGLYVNTTPATGLTNRWLIDGDNSPEVDDIGAGPSLTVNGSPTKQYGPFDQIYALVSQVAREVLTEVAATAYVAQVAREILAAPGSAAGGILLNPDLYGGFKAMRGGF
jgi:hypothetical protein